MRESLRRFAPGIITLVLLTILLVAFFYKWSWININPGQRGVLWNRLGEGTVIDKSFREGVTIIWPWNRMYLYDTRIQQLYHEMDALTEEGLKIHFSLSVRFRPDVDTLPVLHQRIGPDYSQKVVVPEVENVIRKLLARTSIELVYGSQTDRLQQIVSDAVTQIEKDFVEVEAVIIRQIVLPPSVETAIEEKMKQKQLAEAYKYRLERESQEAERKRIEALGTKQANDLITSSLNDKLLTWRWIEAAQNLATSNNTKTIILGNQGGSVPIILGGSGGGQ
jgi:regulator of protease activity HflC (stomatin/prohibitin superfamily)